MTERMTIAQLNAERHPLSVKTHCVGIDAGTSTGFCVYSNLEKRWKVLKTMSFWEAHDYMKTLTPGTTGVVIEVPKKFLYSRNDDIQKRGMVAKVSSDMGGNRREAELLADRFESLGYYVKRVTPITKKWTAAQLLESTGISERTSEHVRDAVKLLWLEGVGDVTAARSARRTVPAAPRARASLSDLWD